MSNGNRVTGPPLVIGALGLAVGAAIGSMVPVTRPEQETMGEASHKLRDKVTAAISSGVDKARDVAGEAYDAAREEADRQGLTGPGKPVTAKIADVAGAAGAKAKKGTRRAMDEAERTMDRRTDDLQLRPKQN